MDSQPYLTVTISIKIIVSNGSEMYRLGTSYTVDLATSIRVVTTLSL